MPTIIAASESSVTVNNEPIDGVRSLQYRRQQQRTNVYALGSVERLGMVSGAQVVEARLTVASASPALDAIGPEQSFDLIANLNHGDTHLVATFQECFIAEKSFEMGAGGHGEAVYVFTATRLAEGPAQAASASA